MKLHIHPEIEAALKDGEAIVALESTVITHGLSAPENIEVATAIEATVREEGAIPATIAILGGEITVGLTPAQLAYLGQSTGVRKCSRRDLPLVVARGEDGATTVAATMIIAHRAGIPLFATGGIGGVHRGQPFDESADLLELGRTPVTVVCAGAKAILDLPLTLEVLETQGVPIIGYQTDELPAFYSRQSGLPIDLRVDTLQEIVSIIRVHHSMQMENALLVTAPVPLASEWPASEAQTVINQALIEADRQGISGKLVTPFLLQRISDLSGGYSQRANIALLYNNARIAAQLAVLLSTEASSSIG